MFQIEKDFFKKTLLKEKNVPYRVDTKVVYLYGTF